MPVVKMPDGALVDMPDNPTEEQLAALRGVAQKNFGQKALDWLKLGGSAAARGVAALPAMLLDLNLFDESGKPLAGMPASDAVQDFGTKPKTTAEKYISSGIEGMTGALTGPGGLVAPAKAAAVGVASGLGAQAGDQLSGGNPLGRIAGGVAGGLGGGYAASRIGNVAPQVSTLAKEGLEGIDPKMIEKASLLQAMAKNKGVDLDLAQALEGVGVPASNLTTIRNVLANNSAGGRVQKTLRGQPMQLELEADAVAGGIPGMVLPRDVAANKLASAATNTVQNAKNARSAAVRADYAKAGDLPESTRLEMAAALKEFLTEPGRTDAAKAAAKEALGKLTGQSGSAEVSAARKALEAAMTPLERSRAQVALGAANAKLTEGVGKPLHALDADTLIGDTVGPFKGTPLTPADPKSAGQIKLLAKVLNERLKADSPEIAAAEAKFARISQSAVNPLKQGPTGQLATPRGYKPDVQASAEKLDALFARGGDAQVHGGGSIGRLANELKAADPEAFPAAVKTFIRGRLDKVFEASPQGPATAGDAASKLWDSLFKTRAQWQGMRDMAAGVARSYDLPEADVVRGLEQLGQITKAAKSRPSSVGGLQSAEAFQMGGKTYGADALRVFGFLPFERAARKLEDATMRRTFSEFDRLLTTPEGAATLVKLSKVPVMSNKAITILSTFYGTTATADGQAEQTPELIPQ
jgi:hypothetical protein